MRKILGISASARVWGNCETSVKQILSAAMEGNAHTAFVRLTDLDIQPCRGCFRCLREGGECPLGDDLYALFDRVREADDLVIAAPVYFLSPAAVLIRLMDRLLMTRTYLSGGDRPRRALTLTLMGNGKWRGVAEPLVNLTASLLGFDILESVSLVAEGPGEVLELEEVAERLSRLGSALVGGSPPEEPERKGICPVCSSDFFRIEPPAIVCPVCGLMGDLGTYASKGEFVSRGGPARWGRTWLAAHINSWIRPSLGRYVGKRKEILKTVRRLKDKYREEEERGRQDVQ